MAMPAKIQALILSPSDDRRGVVLNWNTQETGVDEYRIYRGGSVVQSTSDGPYNILSTDTLEIKFTGAPRITIPMTGVTPGAATSTEVVSALNLALPAGVSAFVSETNPNRFYIRLYSGGKGAMFSIPGGTAQSNLYLPSGPFWSRQNTFFQLIKTILQTDLVNNSFEDRDGREFDYYKVIAANTTGPFNPGVSELVGKSSFIKTLGAYVENPKKKVVISGTILNPDGSVYPNAEILLTPPLGKIPSLDNHLRDSTFGISKQFSITYSDVDGYFEIEALPSVIYRMKIEAIDYDQLIKTSTTNQDFTKLTVDALFEGIGLTF